MAQATASMRLVQGSQPQPSVAVATLDGMSLSPPELKSVKPDAWTYEQTVCVESLLASVV